MQSPIHSHLNYLQDTLSELTSLLAQPMPGNEYADIQERIEIVNMAIDHYQRAHTLKSGIRNTGAGTVLPSAVTRRSHAAPTRYKWL